MGDHPVTLPVWVKINMAFEAVRYLGGQGAFRVGLLADSQRTWGCWREYVSRAKGWVLWLVMLVSIHVLTDCYSLLPGMTVFTEHPNLAMALGYPGWHWGEADRGVQQTKSPLLYFDETLHHCPPGTGVFLDKVYVSHQVILKTNKGNGLSTRRIVFFTGFKTSVSLILKVFFSGGISYMNKCCFCG